jgi:hypothetical protein
MAEATRMKAERKAIEKAIQEAEQRKVVSPHLEGVDDEGWTRAFESPTNILGDTPEERREKEFLDTGDYETLIAPDLGKRIDTSPKVDVKDIMGEVTDPGSVSYDPTYKTPAEIRTLSQDPDYGQFFRQPTMVETPKSGIGTLGKILLTGATAGAGAGLFGKDIASLAKLANYKKNYDRIQKSALGKKLGLKEFNLPSNLKSTIQKAADLRSRPEGMPEHLGERGFRTRKPPKDDGENVDKTTLTKQVAGGEDVVTKTANQFAGTEVEGQISSLVQNDLTRALQHYAMMTSRIEAGYAPNRQEMDVYKLLEYYLNQAAPKLQGAAYGGSVDKALTGRSRDI